MRFDSLRVLLLISSLGLAFTKSTTTAEVRNTNESPTPGNTALWLTPVDVTIEQLIEFSIARSDNTSAEKLLQVVGGPLKVTERMRSLGFQNINIHSTVAEYVKTRQNPNVGSADDLVKLLVQLHEGKLVQPANQKLLIGFMERSLPESSPFPQVEDISQWRSW